VPRTTRQNKKAGVDVRQSSAKCEKNFLRWGDDGSWSGLLRETVRSFSFRFRRGFAGC
jgi:hypothetical protein